MDRRKKLKQHIRAAKEWLGQAEHSLEREDDIKSELKLMLAKAELKRADETDATVSKKIAAKAKKTLRRIAPPVAAVIAAIALGVLPANDDGEVSVSEKVPQSTPQVDTPSEKNLLPATDKTDESVVTEVRDASAVENTPTDDDAVAAEESSGVTTYAPIEPHYVYAAPSSHKPDDDMQQLMQSAYFSLRKDG